MTDPEWHELQNELMEHSYDDVERTNTSPDPMARVLLFAAEKALYDAHVALLVATHPSDASFRLLDLGCGDGRVAHAVAQRFPKAEVVGVDGLERSIALAQSLPALPNVSFVLARFDELGALEPFDHVICSEVYEHVDDPPALLRQIHGLLRPGGLVSLSTPSGWTARVPRLTLLRERLFDRERFRLRLHPERAWREALPLHPGTHWPVLRRRLRENGFTVVHRSSGVPWVDPGSRSVAYFARRAVGTREPDRSALFALCLALSRGDRSAAARRLYAWYLWLEGLMNVLPPARLLESRIVVLARRD